MNAGPEGVGVATFEDIDGDGEDGADEEEVEERAVANVVGEVVSGADGAPDETGVEFGAGEGTGEVVDGVGGADAADVAETPVQDADGAEGSEDHSDALDDEDFAGGNLGLLEGVGRGMGGRTLQ